MKKTLIILMVAMFALVAVSCEKEEVTSPYDVENETIIGEWRSPVVLVLGVIGDEDVQGNVLSFNANDRWRAKGHFYGGLIKTTNDAVYTFEWYMDGNELVIAADNISGHNTDIDTYVTYSVSFDSPDHNGQLDGMNLGDVHLKRSRY